MLGKLFYNNIQIGEIKNVEADFPSHSGEFKLTLAREHALFPLISNYIDYSTRLLEFLAVQHQVDDDSEEIENELLEEENYYLDLINADTWVIEEGNGETTRILVPMFESTELLIWRLNTTELK